jgi:two-component system response regulator HydG
MFANHFLQQSNDSLNKSVSGFDKEVLNIFKEYSWPGNLREMKNVIKRATLSSTGEKISKNCLPEEIIYSNTKQQDTNEDQGDLKIAAINAEKETILRVLAETGNNKTKAAEILKIDRKTLYNKLKNFS